VTYRELLITGAATGLLSRLVAEAATGERLLRSSGEGPRREAVRAEANTFRRARHLESGEDLRVWLTARGLTLEEFDQYISRCVARAGAELDGLGAGGELGAQGGELTAKLLFGELACSGAWRAFADTAVRLFAAERLALDADPSGPRPEPAQGQTDGAKPVRPLAEVVQVLRPFGAFDPAWCQERLEVLQSRAGMLEGAECQIRASEAVAVRLGDSRMDWALFRYDELRLRSQAAALEALSCARSDGLLAGEIARRAGSELTALRARRQELPPGHVALLDGAAQDEAVGPVEHEGGFSVLWLRERSRPDVGDPEMVERAVSELLSEALDRAANGAVREIGQL
jgi:hypothetical protein